MENKKMIGRVDDPHPLKRTYDKIEDYYNHQLGKEDHPKSFRGLYDQLKDSCEFFAQFFPKKEMEILDIGSRDGGGVEYFKSCGHKAVGIELSQKLVDHAKGKGIECVQGDMHHMPFDENQFDAIFAKDILEHSYDPQKALIEWSRVLKVEGLAYIECPCLDYNYLFHSYDFTSPEMLKDVLHKVLDIEIIQERSYYTVQTMFAVIFRLKSKKYRYC